LKETPRNPLLLRLEQDLTPPESRAAVCQRHTALFEAQKDADLQYVIDRCVEPASARDRAFLQHYQAAPQNPWLALAAGYTLADHGQWAEAAKALEVARKQLPETTEFVALDLARVRRVMDGEKATLVDILRDSEQLRDLVQLGSGQDVTGSYLAYQSLASGRLDEASQRSLGSPLVQSEISLFVAASEGANPDLATKALARSLTDVTPSGHVWYLLGLAARQGVNTAPYRDLIVKREPGLQQLASQFDGQARINPGLLETQLKGVGIAERGYVYAAAVIAMGVDAPAGWRENARRLLFPAERPFF
jgi:hypothetical protein